MTKRDRGARLFLTHVCQLAANPASLTLVSASKVVSNIWFQCYFMSHYVWTLPTLTKIKMSLISKFINPLKRMWREVCGNHYLVGLSLSKCLWNKAHVLAQFLIYCPVRYIWSTLDLKFPRHVFVSVRLTSLSPLD